MDNKKERRKISIDENGDYIVPKERMEELLKNIDELAEKTGEAGLSGKKNFCCYTTEPYAPTSILDYHNYREHAEWIAEMKCEAKFGINSSVKKGHCDDVLCHDHTRLCD
ncbi:MAG: hypothetical protein JL50_00760 [Peptococcaceae bacterium BICA1-7]|nr:MAG: hypothetical protein JL50_00760 [Peptococcaceae bacterium BICA1-7]HBV98081.1 hypothetical protein [Desulfotomaculum sp.]